MAEPPTSSPELAAAGARDELLATKLSIPRPRPDRLARSRLRQRLDEGLGRALILCARPPAWQDHLAGRLGRRRVPAGGLAVAGFGRQRPARFWRYVATALDRVVGGLGEQLVPLLSPGSGTSTQGVVTALINQLEANPDEVALVLDDYHAIESTVILDSLGFLLSHLPPRLHLAIASEPGSFACWRVDLSHEGGGRLRGWDRPAGGICTTGRWTRR
jgi:LuxR family maltose regulon positive regulatory protein